MGQAGSSAVPDERQTRRKRRSSLLDDACEDNCAATLSGMRWLDCQLPTDAEFVDAAGVSRTVMQQAVVHLASSSVAELRQGPGLLASEMAHYQACHITCGEAVNLSDVIQRLELRLGGRAPDGRAGCRPSDARRQAETLSGGTLDIESPVKTEFDSMAFSWASKPAIGDDEAILDATIRRARASRSLRAHMSAGLKRRREINYFVAVRRPTG